MVIVHTTIAKQQQELQHSISHYWRQSVTMWTYEATSEDDINIWRQTRTDRIGICDLKRQNHDPGCVHIFLMVPKCNLAVTGHVTRKEQKKILPMAVYFRNQRVEEAQYTKFGQIVIPRRFHTKLPVTMPCNIWYGIGETLRSVQFWYIGPPQRADSENIPQWGGIFCSLRVTSLITARFHLGTITKIITHPESRGQRKGGFLSTSPWHRDVRSAGGGSTQTTLLRAAYRAGDGGPTSNCWPLDGWVIGRRANLATGWTLTPHGLRVGVRTWPRRDVDDRGKMARLIR